MAERPTGSPDRARALRLLAGGAVGGTLAWLGCLAGFGLAGGAGSLGWAAVGGGTVLGFFGLGQLVQVVTAPAGTITVLVASLVSYAVRAAGLAAVLLVIQPLATGAGAGALVPTMIAVVVGWLAAEIWVFTRLRVPAFDPPGGARD